MTIRFNENNEVIEEMTYRAVLAGLELGEDISYSMQELEGLAEAAGVTVAVSSAVSPTKSFAVLGVTSIFSVTLLTVTTHFADFLPDTAVMVAVPFATAVTTPSLTVATFASEVDHVTA